MNEKDKDRWSYLGLLADVPSVLLERQCEGTSRAAIAGLRWRHFRIVDNLLKDSNADRGTRHQDASPRDQLPRL